MNAEDAVTTEFAVDAEVFAGGRLEGLGTVAGVEADAVEGITVNVC